MLKKNITRASSRFLRKPGNIWLVFSVVLALTVLGLYSLHSVRSYTSDDVTLQSFLTLSSEGDAPTHITNDTFILKIPFYLFIELFSLSPRQSLGGAVFLFAVLNLVLFFIALKYFLKRFGVTRRADLVLPIIYLLGLGYYFLMLFMVPNLRNFEIGISFFSVMLVARFLDHKPPQRVRLKHYALYTIAIFSFSLFILDDPYFLFATILPVACFVLFLLYRNRSARREKNKQAWIMLAILGSSIILYKLLSKAFTTLFNFSIDEIPLTFINFDAFPKMVWSGVGSVLKLFNANFFGKVATDPQTAVSLLNFAIIGIIVLLICFFLANKQRLRKADPWMVFFALQPLIIFSLYISNQASTFDDTYRYLVVVPFYICILLPVFMSELNTAKKIIINVLLACALVGNTITLPSIAQAEHKHNIKNESNYMLLDTVKQKGYTKGYAGYWTANINSYLSAGEVSILPYVCDEGIARTFLWLVDENRFNTPSDRSFIVLDVSGRETPQCTDKQVAKQFGEPLLAIRIREQVVYFYDYDIGKKLLPRKPLVNTLE